MNHLAQITNPVLTDTLQEMNGKSFIQSFIPAAITLLFVGGSVLFVFMLIIGAIGWITSGGDKAKIEESRGKVTNAIVGILIMLTVYAVVKLVQGFFGTDFSLIEIDLSNLKIGS